jgi:membrane fusion protein
MNGNLFRKEAVEGQKIRLHGDVLVLPSIKLSVVSGFLAIWVLAIMLWLSNSQYARQETVQGWLEPDKGVIRVFAESASGKIKRIMVKEGDYVEKDQSLIVVNGDRILQDGTHLEDKLLDEYLTQKQILTQQMVRNGQIYFHRIQDARKRIASIKLESEQLQEQLRLSEQRHEILKRRVENGLKVRRKGHLSRYDYDTAVSRELSLRSETAGLKRSLLSNQNTQQQLEAELSIYPQEQQNDLSRIQSQLSNLAQKIAQLHGQRAHIIKATQSGFVSNIQVDQGQYTKTNLPLMTIIPADSTIEARLLVPVRAAGFLETGQSIEMRYDAFPYQKFGLHRGIISRISKSAILPNEVNQSAVQVNEPVFLVRAELERNWVHAFGEKLALKPGMTLSADVKLADRSLMEWLLEPLYSIKGKL